MACLSRRSGATATSDMHSETNKYDLNTQKLSKRLHGHTSKNRRTNEGIYVIVFSFISYVVPLSVQMLFIYSCQSIIYQHKLYTWPTEARATPRYHFFSPFTPTHCSSLSCQYFFLSLQLLYTSPISFCSLLEAH